VNSSEFSSTLKGNAGRFTFNVSSIPDLPEMGFHERHTSPLPLMIIHPVPMSRRYKNN
jgi:hypothetical protein